MAEYTEPVVIMTYTNKCGRVNGVSGGENISTPGGAPLRNLTFGNGEIKAEMPDLTGCGHTKSVEEYQITVDIIYEASDCQKTFTIKQYANMESCCSCGDITLNYEDGKAFEVSYEKQTAFEINSNTSCKLEVTANENWVSANSKSNGSRYEIAVPEYTGSTPRHAIVTVKDENGTPCSTYSLSQFNKEVTILKSFDYMTFIYRWPKDGTDLDTATVVNGSKIVGLDGKKVGYSCDGSNDRFVWDYLKFGGDNTSGGTESACLYLGNIIEKIKEDRIETDTITIDLYGVWFQRATESENKEVTIEYRTYSGGTMIDPPSDKKGELFENQGGVERDHASAVVKVTNTSTNENKCDTNIMNRVGTITYNVNAGTTSFVTY